MLVCVTRELRSPSIERWIEGNLSPALRGVTHQVRESSIEGWNRCAAPPGARGYAAGALCPASPPSGLAIIEPWRTYERACRAHARNALCGEDLCLSGRPAFAGSVQRTAWSAPGMVDTAEPQNEVCSIPLGSRLQARQASGAGRRDRSPLKGPHFPYQIVMATSRHRLQADRGAQFRQRPHDVLLDHADRYVHFFRDFPVTHIPEPAEHESTPAIGG